MTRKQTITITALTITAFILAIMVSGRYWTRLDLTRNKAYTISKVSRNLYREIPDPVIITYYLSDRLRTMYPFPAEVEDTLREYAAHSRGRIRVVVRDPVKANITYMVEELGVLAAQVSSIEKDQAGIITVYSGIVIEYLDKIDVLPLVDRIETLEYDLTTRIRSMIRNTERLIGVIVGDSFRKWDEDFGHLNNNLTRTGFKIRQFAPGEEIPDNFPGIFVFGGAEDLDEDALYRIDRYIQLGGKVFFAVKGVYVDTIMGTAQARHLESKGLLEMISNYGAVIKPELVLDRSALTMQYQTQTQRGMMYRITRYPLWIGVTSDNGNPLHPISSNFGGLDMYWASPVELFPSPSVSAEMLFSSTKEGWLQREQFQTSPDIPYMMEMEAQETKGAHILGAALQGVFPSFFKDKEKPLENLPDMPASASSSRIIVIGDVDFATNLIVATNSGKNLDFLLRAADWLTNDDDIIGIRSRQPQIGRLDKILDPSSKASAMRFVQILNLGIVPALLIIIGLYLASKRKRRMQDVV